MRVVKNVLRFLAFLIFFVVVGYIYNSQDVVRFDWRKADIKVGGTTITNCYGLKMKDRVISGKCFTSSSATLLN